MTMEKPNEGSNAQGTSPGGAENNEQQRSDGTLLRTRHPIQPGTVPSSGRIQRSWSEVRSEIDSKARGESGIRQRGAGGFRGSRFRDEDEGEDRRSSRDYQKQITLDAIRHALNDAQLEALLHKTYNPQEKVTLVITDRATSKFAEDCFVEKFVPKKRREKRKSSPAQDHIEIYLEWNKTRVPDDCTNSVVFGAYLAKYQEAFGELDPEWAGNVNIRRAAFNINKMAQDVANDSFFKLIEFVEMLIPLWAKAMRRNLSFPQGRPTFDTFFVRRGMWAQRFSTYKKWKAL